MKTEHLTIPPGLRLHPERPRFLTASDIAAAAGVDEFRSALDLHLEKAGQRSPGGETPLMRRGRLMEGTAIEYLREELPGWKIERPRLFVVCREHRIGCTPDARLEDPEHPGELVNCQIKVVARPTYERWPIDHTGMAVPPMAYMLQTAMENMLLDARYGMLAVLVLSSFDAWLETFTVPRHDDAEAKILRIAADFWQRIERRQLPAVDYSRDAELVAELYPPDPRVETPLDLAGDNRIGELLESRERLKAAKRAAVAGLEANKAEIIAKLRGATYAVAPGWKITNKMQHTAGYTVAAKDGPVLRASRTKEAA